MLRFFSSPCPAGLFFTNQQKSIKVLKYRKKCKKFQNLKPHDYLIRLKPKSVNLEKRYICRKIVFFIKNFFNFFLSVLDF